jgi:hypothetical protein
MKTSRPFAYRSKSAAESDREFAQTLEAHGYDRLKAQWKRKLAKSGFQDIESPSGELHQPNIRTVAWVNRDAIREFFLKLDQYLAKHDGIPPLHRKVLELYSAGVYIVDIVESVHRSRTTVKNIIRRYKRIVLQSYR